MDSKDVLLFGSARAYGLVEEDENADCMYQLNYKDGPTPYHLPGTCPLDAIEDVAMGGDEADTILFLGKHHVIQVGGREWSLDGDLALWRKARVYANDMRERGFLSLTGNNGIVEYSRRLMDG